MKYQILYNPHAGNGKGEAEARKLSDILKDGELVFRNMTELDGYAAFFDGIGHDDVVVICGGDGTLNRFINETDGLHFENPIYYYASGSGNDFWHDLGKTKGDAPVCIDAYIRDLPVAEIKGRTYRVLNGIGYGIDGYCCEVGDKLRETSDKPIQYSSIAIKGLLFHYHPCNAVITVDGVRHIYRKVWLAPVMNGRYYGGGMMPTPAQDRLAGDGKVSVMVMYGSGKLKTLAIFPSIFSGKHVSHTDTVEVLTGQDITVSFDRPTALQVDGETIPAVRTCHVCAAKHDRDASCEDGCAEELAATV